MKFEKFQRISESNMRLDRIGVILGIVLLAASCGSYFLIDAFGQQVFLLDCPENAYHGIDNQGTEACRDIITNEIVFAQTKVTLEINSEQIVKSESTITEAEFGSNQNSSSTAMPFLLIVIAGVGIFVFTKKRNMIKLQSGWTSLQKEQVRDRQFGKCNMCFTTPKKWKYDYFDGNKNNKNLSNCQGLCPSCLDKKIQRENELFS